MERYRVNYWLLGTLAIGAVLLAGAVTGIWMLQRARYADQFKEDARTAIADGDYEGAAKHLNSYLNIYPEDRETNLELASVRVKLAEFAIEERQGTEAFRLVGSVENTLSKYPEEPELRKQIADYYLKKWPNTDNLRLAANHYGVLLSDPAYSDDLELKKDRAFCLMAAQQDKEALEAHAELVGYDAADREFKEEPGPAADDHEAYARLANILLRKLDRPDEAIAVIEKLVERNPKSGMAYLTRAQFRPAFAQNLTRQAEADALREQAKDDIDKAFELEPGNETVELAYIGQKYSEAGELLQESAELEKEAGSTPSDEDQAELDRLKQQADEQLAKVAELAEQSLKRHPDNVSFYNVRAQVAKLRDDVASAIAELEAGINQEGVSDEAAMMLQLYKAEMMLSQNQVKETSELLAELRKKRLSVYPVVENKLNMLEAQVLLRNNRWYEGKELLEKTRAQMPSGTPEQRNDLASVDYLLGLAYENLGMKDLAVSSYDRVLQNSPGNANAKFGLERLAERAFGDRSSGREDRTLIEVELRKPVDERNWDAVLAKVENFAAEQGLDVKQTALLRAEVHGYSGDFAAARKEADLLLKENPENLQIWRTAAKLYASDPDQGPVEGIKLLRQASEEEHFGDIPILRIDRADMLMAINDDDMSSQVMALTEDIGDWDNSQKVQLFSAIGRRFLMLRQTENAVACFRKVIELAPSDLKTLDLLFALALESRDDEQMKKVQSQILDVVKSKTHPNYMYAEAARLFSLYKRDAVDDPEATVKQIRALLKDTIDDRSEWPEPYLLLGNLEMDLGNTEAGMDALGKGLELGSNNAVAALTYIRILTAQGRFFKARDAVEKFDPSLRLRVLGRVYAEILRRTNAPEEAFEAANRLAEANPSDPDTQLWYGQFVQTLANAAGTPEDLKKLAIDRSGEALAKVVELIPASQEAWLAYITHLRTTDNLSATEQAIREAQLALPEDAQTGVLARSYELVGRWFDAEKLYRQTYESDPEETRFIRALAQFYLGPIYNQPDKQEKATVLINELLELADQGKTDPGDPHVQWARRQAARILAASGDYQDLLKAEKLLRSSATEGQELPLEDRLELALILAPRPEPESRKRAIAILEGIKPYQDLVPEQELLLAQLYNKTDNWPKSRTIMTALTAKYPQVPGFRIAYIRMLLDRGGRTELGAATQQLSRLQQLIPDAAETQELMAFLAKKTGEEEKAQQTLRNLANRAFRDNSPNKAGRLLRMAQLLVQLDDTTAAGAIYQKLAEANPDDFRYQLALASFLGENSKADEAFAMLGDARGDVPHEAVLQTALQINRAARDEFGDKYDNMIGEWIAAELRENPGSFTVLMQQAEFKDLQGKYEESAAIYRSLLDSGDLEGRARAIVLNNLSYMIGMGAAQEAVPNEALKLVKEAEQILGPSSDILDTRAVIELVNKNYQEAVDLMTLAVTDGATASKYLHKAQAHLGLGQNRLAIDAWDQAIDAGLSADSVNRLELDAYEIAAARIQELKTQ